MLRDVFYYGKKPNVHPREKFAKNLDDARQQSTTEHFWIINEFCDYKGFDWDWDFEFLPDEDVWTEEHNNVWPSVHQKDSGTWLCNTDNEQALIVYRADVEPLKRKNQKTDEWVALEKINEAKFDFSWHPDPTDPPYIYKWGCKYFPVELQPCLEYHCPDATMVKYMTAIVELLPNDHWVEVQQVDKTKFDMSWRPSPLEPPYIYIWGNKHVDPTLRSTLEYHCPGATETKYMPEKLEVLPEWDRWEILAPIDESTFDFTWRPDPREPNCTYVWGNTQYDSTLMPTVKYHMPDATYEKHMTNDIKLLARPDSKNWNVLIPIDKNKFDFSWVPHPNDPPYIYVFGNQWNRAELEPTVQYHVEGATDKKYISDIIATVTPYKENWTNVEEVESFDYSWRPDPTDPPYIYVFGNTQYDGIIMPTVTLTKPDATDKKYITDIRAKLKQRPELFTCVEKVSRFDYSWRPDPKDPPFIYVFGNKQYPGTIMPTVELHVEGATERKYIDDVVATLAPMPALFENTTLVKDFDYTWRPNPKDPPFIYQFGTQWAKTHGPTFTVEGATEVKYVEDVKATVLPDMTYWEVDAGVDTSKFDFSWHPDALAPKYIYQFGTLVDDKDGPRYVMPDNNGEVVYIERTEINIEDIQFPRYYIKTTLQDLIEEHSDEIFWALRENINYDNFNFGWVPDKENVYHINAFGSPDSETTQSYFVNGKMIQKGYTDINFIENIKLDEEYLASLFKPVSMFYIDRGNSESQARFDELAVRFPAIQKTRFLNTWVDTINRCINRSPTELCWILNSELDYAEFDFNYYPNPWQMKMVHVFGTQWSHWGTTFMVNRETFAKDTKYVKIIEHLSNLNFVKSRRAKATSKLYETVYVNHGNMSPDDIEALTKSDTRVIDYDESYFNTFKKLLKDLPFKKDHFIWVCSSVCAYDDFDFTYICDPFTREQLHVFPSDKQKFGDTFLINVNRMRDLIEDITKLEDYSKINFNGHQRVKRLSAPSYINEKDTHVSITDFDFNWPYITIQSADNKEINIGEPEPMNLWAPETKNIIVHTTGGTCITVPKEAKDYVKRELYDYPYISKLSKLVKSKPLDIVFLSNGETGADENYEHLLSVTRGLPNRVVRVDGVNGRVAAYHAAAEASETPWMFTVFAKLKIDKDFDWTWQPDRLQVPKHYVFHAKNPVNGLVYGHQAMIAYNKKLTLANQGKGLDFTMDDEHEIVELLSGTAQFNTDEWSTWRTAFRESLKLRANTDEVSENRLNQWLTVGSGEYFQYSIDGAKDAVQYYEEVNGDFDKLKLSYDWPWLRAFFESKYK